MKKILAILAALVIIPCVGYGQSTVTQSTYPTVGAPCYVPGQKIIVQVGINVLAIFQCQSGGIVQIGGSPNPNPSGGSSGVSSFNTRTGAVTLAAADVNGVGAITNSTTGTAALASGLNSTALAVANTWTVNQSISGVSNVYLNLTQTGGSTTSYDVIANGNVFAIYDATHGLGPLSIISTGSYNSVEMPPAEVFGWCGGACSLSSPSLDTAYSRVSAGVIALGNGTAGNASGTLEAANYVAGPGGLFETTHGSNATAGVSNLSSGTVTVSTTAIAALAAAGAAGDVVQLTLQSCSTCGTLSVGTVIPGTSFVINSTNALDASNVYWEIRKLN